MSDTTAASKPLSDILREHEASLRGGMIIGADMRTIADSLSQAARCVDRWRDEDHIRVFAAMMTGKMALKTAQGVHGWPNLPTSHLWAMLKEHVAKGDPIDIAIFAMMIHHNTAAELRGWPGA